MEPYKNLSTVKFYKLPDYIDMRKIIATKVAQNPVNPVNIRNSIGSIYYFFKESLIHDKEFKYTKNPAGKFLLYYGMFNCRKDHLKNFLNFSSHFHDADICNAYFLDKTNISFFYFIKCIPLFFIWLFQMLSNRISLGEACNAIRYVQLTYQYSIKLQPIFKKHYKFVVVYYDTSPDENYVVQEFSRLNVVTMTLQHGIFSRKNVLRTISDTAFELSESMSDYFLVWNKYTQDEAVKVGLKREKVIILGVPKFIDISKPTQILASRNKIFGVILNNSAFDIHNRKLIETANEISNITGYKYILRYHPQMHGNEYKILCNNNFLSKGDNSKSIAEYATEVSFTIISSSSVFVDLLMLKHPVYRLRVSEEDTYSTVSFNSFGSIEELNELLCSKSEDENAFAYLCNDYNIFENYRKFFDKFI